MEFYQRLTLRLLKEMDDNGDDDDFDDDGGGGGGDVGRKVYTESRFYGQTSRKRLSGSISYLNKTA
ncbi:hypothetical protein T07_1130 [Trichinella nelsoni]|uniref:Uncharacterized protein n=1 Tax=Trichinella nelsoni TaxID=6336 RepID=A0A0V0SK86_9BILA|nr:hypothetical protein T07_1130 [Trichinella nelsoni]